jgi:hypothetical protein
LIVARFSKAEHAARVLLGASAKHAKDLRLLNELAVRFIELEKIDDARERIREVLKHKARHPRATRLLAHLDAITAAKTISEADTADEGAEVAERQPRRGKKRKKPRRSKKRKRRKKK